MIVLLKKMLPHDRVPLLATIRALLLCGMLVTAPVLAAEDVTAGALKLYEKHHYEDAARLLRPALASMDGSRQAAASLALGMIYLRSAALYRELHRTALVIELDYLAQLKKQKTGSTSRFVDFYLGQALLEAGKPGEAATYLRRFAERVGANSPMQAFAEIELGIAYSRQKQPQQAAGAWSNLDVGNPAIKAALAGAYAETGVQAQKPVEMADAVLQGEKLLHHAPDARMVRNLLRVYSQSGAPEKALDLIDANGLKDAVYVENLGSFKSINFYDLSLLRDMAKTHLAAALLYLEQAKRDVKTGPSASYYLADAYLQQGDAELSLRAAASFLAQVQIPQQHRDSVRLYQAGAHYMEGRRAEAGAIWQSFAEAQDPALLAEVLQSCARTNADCSRLEKRALASAERGEGKKFFLLNASLGKYYLLKKDYTRALLYLEAGRDKAYKNKIEVNDPVMLTGLAEAYYRNKKFSENLEIYFEIGKQYPLVRQIQEAMQGIYAMEQQSAGEVKIF